VEDKGTARTCLPACKALAIPWRSTSSSIMITPEKFNFNINRSVWQKQISCIDIDRNQYQRLRHMHGAQACACVRQGRKKRLDRGVFADCGWLT
jgi:hypothetical protein